MGRKRVQAEYIWLDGTTPTQCLRSKTKILDERPQFLGDIPKWGFDGSSTLQAEGHFSDCQLKPVHFVHDPLRANADLLVMCEVLNPDGTPHKTNTRRRLEEVWKKYRDHEPWVGIEQEYTLMSANPLFDNKPFAWECLSLIIREPSPQGPYYCSVGARKNFGRKLIEAHTAACLKAGLLLSGTNAEVMPGQWEFQVGPLSPLECSDELYLARWLLQRLGEDYNIVTSFDPKPMNGDWNGAGGHTNFSTKFTRADGGLKVIEAACEKLRARHAEHIAVYGAGNEKRLTGRHETCSIRDFRWGVSDRGASVRVPMATKNDGKGYLEDRRPAANLDPYIVCTALIETVCGDGFRP